MNSLINKLNTLSNGCYLKAVLEDGIITNIELLSNGKLLREQIEKQWRCTGYLLNGNKKVLHCKEETIGLQNNFKNLNPRLHFIYSQSFRRNMQYINTYVEEPDKHTSIKTILHRTADRNEFNVISKKSNGRYNSTLLITDFFFHANSGLAKFYNTQRERKIWWMRFSADPSHYYLEPYELAKNDSSNKTSTFNAQSITIKSHLPLIDSSLEHLTLIPLNEMSLENKEDFEILNERTNKKQIPAIIRSVIDLDVATCALILDSMESNSRENTLFINRKIAPYQCLVISESKETNCLNDLNDLATHLCNVIRRANLRILDATKLININGVIKSQSELSDMIGIPYIILINLDSLNTGLLRLRCRDTTLEETIHISDIPGYLLNIFNAI